MLQIVSFIYFTQRIHVLVYFKIYELMRSISDSLFSSLNFLPSIIFLLRGPGRGAAGLADVPLPQQHFPAPLCWCSGFTRGPLSVEPPQLAPFNVKEQWPYSELLSSVRLYLSITRSILTSLIKQDPKILPHSQPEGHNPPFPGRASDVDD